METTMRTYKLEQSDKEITSHAGIALIGSAVENYTSLSKAIDAALPKRHGTPTSDIVKTCIGNLAQGKTDFEAINNVRGNAFFHQAMNLKKDIPTEACIRMRLQDEAEELIPLIDQVNSEFLIRRKVPVTPLYTGHTPLDIDGTPHDNSNSKKECVSFTYKGMDGYTPMASYLGQEGWGIGYELRPGSQHGQSEFIYTLERNFDAVHKIMEPLPPNRQAILVRLDSGHDAKENRVWFQTMDTPLLVDYIIKWNPRGEASEKNKQKWFEYAKQLGHLADWSNPREGKRVVTFSIYEEEEYQGKTCTSRRIMQITERSIDKHGQLLIMPELEIEGWCTTLEQPDEEVKALYRDHATSEQFHSEIKTDLDLERLPSGKFDTNDLILTMGMVTYNILKWIGLEGLMGSDSPVRHKAKRRRVRTVMQELIYIGAHIYERGRRLFIRFGRTTPAYQAFWRVYNSLAYG